MLTKNYNKFILESLILEAQLELDSSFIEKVNRIKDNKIAIAIQDSISRHIDIPNLKFNNIGTSKKGDLITFDNSKSELRIGRYIKHISDVLGLNASDPEIEDFVNKYKATSNESTDKFDIVSGEIIRHWYLENNYAVGLGSLNKSCMRFQDSLSKLDMYALNPSQISLLIHRNEDNELLGRALLWKLDESPCSSNLFMDRIYVSDDYVQHKFIKWADSNNYFIKYLNTFEKKYAPMFKYKGDKVSGVISLTLKDKNLKYLPYSDTLKYYNNNSGFLSNIGFHRSVLLEDINGAYETCVCGGSAEDRCVYCDGIGRNDCPDCKGHGENEEGIDCAVCRGKGDLHCAECDGDGLVLCPDCADWKKWLS